MMHKEQGQLQLIHSEWWKKSSQRGQSILEIIVAMAIFALITAAMTSMVLGGFAALTQGGEHTQAEALAQEGIEAVRSIRDGAWNEIVYNQAEVSQSSGQWVVSEDTEADGEEIGQFTRAITFSDVCRDSSNDVTGCPGSYIDVHSKKVTVSVSWEIREGITNSVQRVAYLTNWDSRDWTQTDWTGESGINMDTSTAGELKLTCGGILDSGFDAGGTCSGTPSACSSQGESVCSSCGCDWNTGSCSNSGACLGCGDNPQCKPCEPFGCSWSKGNCIGTLNCSSASDETNCIACNQCAWNSGDCNGTPSNCSAHSDETNCINCGCIWSGGAWSYSAWDVGPGEVTPIGSQNSSGGNPNGYVDITVPQGNNDKVGGYWEQSFTTYQGNPVSATFDFDYQVIDFNSAPDVAEIRVYIDTTSGTPITQVGSSTSIIGEDAWTSATQIDVSSAITSANTYYLKIALWLETPGGNPGPYTVGFDNANLDLGNSTCSASGELVSSVYDMADVSPIQIIEWDETLLSGSDIKFQIRAAETEAGLSSESWSSYFNTAGGELISTDYNGNRWVQYRVELSGDGNDTPILQEIRINYK